MITAKSAHELAQPVTIDSLVKPALFYIEQYVRDAARRGQTETPFILADELLDRAGAAESLIAELEAHEFTVTRAENALTISWAASDA